MKLPVDAIIAEEKLTHYLLVPQVRETNWHFSRKPAMRALESNEFGQYFEIRGNLRGPNGVSIRVRTIWMKEHLSEAVKFITLIPDRRTTA